MNKQNWSTEGITLDLRKLLRLSFAWELDEVRLDAIDYMNKELQEYQAQWGKAPDAFFIQIEENTIFGIPLKVKREREEEEQVIKKLPHYY